MPTPAEKELRAALDASMEMNGDPKKGERQMAARNDQDLKLPRVAIDMKIPLPAVIAAAIVLAGGGISMYYKVNAIGDAMVDMKATLTANAVLQTSQGSDLKSVQSDMNLLRYRIDKIEGEKK